MYIDDVKKCSFLAGKSFHTLITRLRRKGRVKEKGFQLFKEKRG